MERILSKGHGHNESDCPLVSVIIPTLNSEATLSKAIESVLGQSYEHVEVVVVDGGSTDSTTHVAETHRVEVINSHALRSTSRRIGVASSHGEFLFFLDSDQVASPGLLQEAVHLCTTELKEAAVVPEADLGEGFWYQCHSFMRQIAQSGNLVYPRFYSLSAYKAVGGHSDGLEDFMEDRDLYLRYVAGGGRVCRTSSKIFNLVGRVNPIEMGVKAAKAARDARSYFHRNRGRGESVWGMIRPRLAAWFRCQHLISDHPIVAAALPIYALIAVGPRLLSASLARLTASSEQAQIEAD